MPLVAATAHRKQRMVFVWLSCSLNLVTTAPESSLSLNCVCPRAVYCSRIDSDSIKHEIIYDTFFVNFEENVSHILNLRELVTWVSLKFDELWPTIWTQALVLGDSKIKHKRKLQATFCAKDRMSDCAIKQINIRKYFPLAVDAHLDRCSWYSPNRPNRCGVMTSRSRGWRS